MNNSHLEMSVDNMIRKQLIRDGRSRHQETKDNV